MQTTFYIKFTLRTQEGFESFGQFFIGNDRPTASVIFESLKGSLDVHENNILQLDFIETVDGLPFNINVLRCTLNEMAENCKIITKAVFNNRVLK